MVFSNDDRILIKSQDSLETVSRWSGKYLHHFGSKLLRIIKIDSFFSRYYKNNVGGYFDGSRVKSSDSLPLVVVSDIITMVGRSSSRTAHYCVADSGFRQYAIALAHNFAHNWNSRHSIDYLYYGRARNSTRRTYWVAQLKWSQLTLLFVKFE